MLIDPEVSMHKSFMEFFGRRGFLSYKQLASLRNHNFSIKDIERLTTSITKQPEDFQINTTDAPPLDDMPFFQGIK